MVIEHVFDQYVNSQKESLNIVTQMFKSIKDKLIQMILKDTNASVRDACVSTITTFKNILGDDASVMEAIKQLPKYRVTEITKNTAE